MKLNFKVFTVLLIGFLLFSFNLLAAEELNEAEQNTNQAVVEQRSFIAAEIPLFQRSRIVNKKDIDYSFLMREYSGNNEIVIENALSIEVLSNAKWQLRINNRNLNSALMIKRSNSQDSEWQNLNSTTAKFSGVNGVERINFDLKFILDPNFKSSVNNLELDLKHRLDPILY